jgi:hypothetical protein
MCERSSTNKIGRSGYDDDRESGTEGDVRDPKRHTPRTRCPWVSMSTHRHRTALLINLGPVRSFSTEDNRRERSALFSSSHGRGSDCFRLLPGLKIIIPSLGRVPEGSDCCRDCLTRLPFLGAHAAAARRYDARSPSRPGCADRRSVPPPAWPSRWPRARRRQSVPMSERA